MTGNRSTPKIEKVFEIFFGRNIDEKNTLEIYAPLLGLYFLS
jgi:hypothetical protein